MDGLHSFTDWVHFGNAGFIQSAFSWAYFNQGSFYRNVYMRQMQQYQKKNYTVTWTYIARRDILNMMGITVQRMSNYMVVSAILFSAAAVITMSAKFLQQSNPYVHELDKFIMHAFYASMAAANGFFIAAIAIAVEGQNLAFTETMKLLTFHVRPENPADYNHDYMMQAQWIEKLGVLSLFRLPGLMPDYQADPDDPVQGSRPEAKSFRLEDLTHLENCDIKTIHAAYLAKFAEFARLWMAFDEYSKYCVGVANIEFAQGLLCWVLGWLVAKDYPFNEIAGACWMILMTGLVFAFLLYIKVFESPVRFVLYATIVLNHCIMAVCIFAPHDTLKEILYPFWFFFHGSKYCVILYLGQFDKKVLAEQKTIPRSFWDSSDSWYSSHSANVSLLSDESQESSTHQQSTEQLDQRYPEHTPVQTEDSVESRCPGRTDDIDTRTFGSYEELEARVRHNIRMLRRIIRSMLVGFLLLWLALGAAAAHYAWVEFSDRWGGPPGLSMTQQAEERESMSVAQETPSQYFQLRAITCTDDVTFVADDYSIFQLGKHGWTEYPCSEKGTIQDVLTSCTTDYCWPVALVRNGRNASKLLDCKTGEVMRFLQEATLVDHVAIKYDSSPKEGLKRQKLIAEHAGKVIQYTWSDQHAGWKPEWTLVRDTSFWGNTQGERRIVGLSTAQNHLSVFLDASPGEPAIARYNLGSMSLVGKWTLSLPIAGGCDLDKDARQMMVLPRKDPFAGGVHDITRITVNA